MAFAINQGFVQNSNGRVQPGATVTVYLDTVGQPLATQVYADRDGATPKGNPFVADSDGYYFFYAPGGAYKLVATYNGSSRTLRHVALGLGAESDQIAVSAGASWQYNASTSMADPGSGIFRLNDATHASATAIAISAISAGAAAMLNALMAWDDSTNPIRGTLRIAKAADQSFFQEYSVTGTNTNNTTWVQMTIAHVASSGVLTDGEETVITFARAGNIGPGGTGSGDVIGPASSTDKAAARFDGTGGQQLQDSGLIIDDAASGGVGLSPVTSINDGPLAGMRNRIINGAMEVAQRGTSLTSAGSANSDGAYTLDGKVLLSDGNDIVDVTQATDVPTGGLFSMGLDVETVNKKFIIGEIIEQKNCIGLIGRTVTFSFWLRVTSTAKLDNIKPIVAAWSGAADAPTRDIVSAWNVEGTNPTLVANWTYENTPTNINPTTSWVRYQVSCLIDAAAAKNIFVGILSDVTDTTLGDFIYTTDWQLEVGSVATDFARKSIRDELADCQRYLRILDTEADFRRFGMGQNVSTTSARVFFGFDPPMRAAPSFAQVGTVGNFALVNSAGSIVAVTAFAASSPWPGGIVLSVDVASGLTAGHATQLASNNAAGSSLRFSAEL